MAPRKMSYRPDNRVINFRSKLAWAADVGRGKLRYYGDDGVNIFITTTLILGSRGTRSSASSFASIHRQFTMVSFLWRQPLPDLSRVENERPSR